MLIFDEIDEQASKELKQIAFRYVVRYLLILLKNHDPNIGPTSTGTT